MKQFLTSLLGSLVALFIFSIGLFLLAAGIAGAIVSSGLKRTEPAETRVEPGSYLVYDLSSNLTDSPPEYDLSAFGAREDTLQLKTVIQALRVAAHDPRISGLLLVGSFRPVGIGTGYGALQELRWALLAFRASGKPIEAYLNFATTRDYYIASVANEIDIDPYGVLYMPGLAVEPMFYAGAFQKYGIGVQVTRVGKYKNYVEPFTRENMSPASREETQRLLDDIWGSILNGVSRSRHLTVPRIQAIVDSEGLIRADVALRDHLVDRVEYRDQLIDTIRRRAGRADGTHTFKQVALADYAKRLHRHPARGSGRIAIVYAEGDIVDGEGDYTDVGGERFARELRKLRQDANVKAIVLRVDSPGGSASAAEDIQHEVQLARRVKPVVVSMGSYAASGGYWISIYGTRIFAEPMTITGSIGVFGMTFDIQKLAANFGITFDRVKTGKFADAMTITRPKTPEEMAHLQAMVDWIYNQFVDKVAQGRNLPVARVREIAQGRVWS
ncbi:MAG: signal peptide peptidase SppA, partial [Opitutaceae bacterium]